MRKFIQLIKNKLTVKCYRFKFGSSPTTETRLTFLYSLRNKTPVPSFFFVIFKKIHVHVSRERTTPSGRINNHVRHTFNLSLLSNAAIFSLSSV